MIEGMYGRLLELSLRRTVPMDAELASILSRADRDELAIEDVNALVNVIYAPDFIRLREVVLDASSRLRKRVFGNRVVIMAPVEVSNACASDCSFCGWRTSNQAMKRLKVSDDLVLEQVAYLIRKGIHYIEFVGGDDLDFVRNRLPALISRTREMERDWGVRLKLCFCTMALTETQYRSLKDAGADSMIVWQETYDPHCYKAAITRGPKARGIADDWSLLQNGDGFSFRLNCQERALKAGLEVALGAMLGMNENLNFEVLATVAHARSLMQRYPISSLHPLIIGMPIWNHIPTSSTDMRPAGKRVIDPLFSYLAAVLFLGLPKGKAWVFPNCRVSPETQIEAVKVAGVFTSTEVKLGPGGYLPGVLREKQRAGEDIRPLFERVVNELNESSADLDSLERSLCEREQFCHHFGLHETYVARMEQEGLSVLSSPTLD